MPQVINRQSESSNKGLDSSNSAVVKQRKKKADGQVEASPKAIIVAGLVTLLFVAVLIHLYVHPFVSPAKKIDRVPPLPGFADQPPYNTREWQEAYKAGRATPISGVPRGPAAAALSGTTPR